MNRQTTLSLWCERFIEGCWLLAITLIPIYFNLFSARHFEPDKASVLRSLVLAAAAAGLIRALEGLSQGERRAPQPAGESPPARPSLWQRVRAVPLALPTLVYVGVFLLATATSVVPLTSFWGSYQRLQGTYTNLSYIGLALIVVVMIRSRVQFERLITVTLGASLAVVGYGLIQHSQIDPLPWRGDVITRVASTMGNSIFVAAYLIMILPLALYRLVVAAGAIRTAPPAERTGAEWLWGLARVLLIFASLSLLLAVIKFGAAVRTADFRYWWVFPGAVAVCTGLWWLLSVRFDRADSRLPIWPGVVYASYMVLFGLLFAIGSGQGGQAADTSNARTADWWLWMLLSFGGVGAFYGMALGLPRLSGETSRVGWGIQTLGYGALTAGLLLTIFYTQSRGPWIGAGAGLFIFFTALLIQGIATAKANGQAGLAGRLRVALGSWVALTLAVGGFLIAFNLSNAPFFQELRKVPYIGRMGQLLEVNSGTGLVRRLIWSGDEHAGGAVGLILSNPLRAVIGWGPESMFVAFNPFYPPSLANIEARGASPDRSHQAILDEMVNKGLLGLASYVFLLGSFYALAWRLMRRSQEWRWKVFFIAAMSSVTAHFVEGLFGIPIVSTLMMLWLILALTVVGGHLAGQYSLAAEAPAPAEEPPPAAQAAPKAGARQPARRGAVARGASRARPAPRQGQAGPAYLAYGMIGLMTLGAIWWFNLNPIYADMRFQQGQAFSDRPDAGMSGLVQSLDDYLSTIRNNPREDFYYLNLGRVLMSIADNLRAQGVPMGDPKPDAALNDLLELRDIGAITGFVQSSSPMQMMSYAEAVLTQAHELNRLNKDHYANLGRLNNFWYGWTRDPSRLQASIDWYTQVGTIAPQDVMLMNERAGVLMTMGEYLKQQGDQTGAESYYTQAEDLLDRSRTLDQRYIDTDIRLGDLFRAQGRVPEAVDRYVAVIERAPQQMNASIERIAAELSNQPDQVRRLRDAYLSHAERARQSLEAGSGSADNVALLYAVAGVLSVRAGDNEQAVTAYQQAAILQPGNAEFARNHTIVLSDTNRFAEAAQEARRTSSLLAGIAGREEEGRQFLALAEYLDQRAGGQ